MELSCSNVINSGERERDLSYYIKVVACFALNLSQVDRQPASSPRPQPIGRYGGLLDGRIKTVRLAVATGAVEADLARQALGKRRATSSDKL